MKQIGDIKREQEAMFRKRNIFANSIKIADDAPEEARRCLEHLKQEFRDGKHDDTIIALCSALAYKAAREGL